jgi:hypothetical protein
MKRGAAVVGANNILCGVCLQPIRDCACGVDFGNSHFGWLYILHLIAQLGNPANSRSQASHYTGWCGDPEKRDHEHRAGRGAALTRAAVARGIDWTMYVLGPGKWELEKRLKALKAGPRICPRCGVSHRGGRLHVARLYDQLALPLDPFAVPAPASARVDWYEIRQERAWRAQHFTGDRALGEAMAADLGIPW